MNVISYELPSILADYQSAIINQDFEKANVLIQKIPTSYHDRMARFLDQIEMKEEAFNLTKDLDHKF